MVAFCTFILHFGDFGAHDFSLRACTPPKLVDKRCCFREVLASTNISSAYTLCRFFIDVSSISIMTWDFVASYLCQSVVCLSVCFYHSVMHLLWFTRIELTDD